MAGERAPWDTVAVEEEAAPWDVEERKPAPTPDMAPMKEFFQRNLAAAKEKPAEAPIGPQKPKPEPTPAEGMLEALEAGWGMSVTGLLQHGAMPDKLLPEHAPMASRIASQVGTLAGDAPAMILGAFAGGAAGTAVPVVGNVIGAGAGSFALPAAIRETLVQHYEKGDIKDFGDFWERSSAVLWETVKGGVVGGATMGAGNVAKVMGPIAATSAELATMVTVGAALEGQIPKAQDFADAAVVLGGLKGSTHLAGKLRAHWAKTGEKPSIALEKASSDPHFKQELLTSPPPPTAEMKTVKIPSEHANNVTGDAPKEMKIAPVEKLPEDKLAHAYTELVDEFHPINQVQKLLAGEKLLEAKEDPYKNFRLSRGAYGKVDAMLEFGPYKFDSLESTGTRGLKKILEPFKDDVDGFREYAKAARAQELHTRGIETGLDAEAVKTTVKEGKSKYDKAFRELVDFQNDTLAYLKDSGVLNEKSYKAMVSANQNYVPFYRVMEEGVGGNKSIGKGFSVKNPIRAIEGSKREIVDPLESVIKNTYSYVILAERNRALRSLVELAEKSPEGAKFFQKQKETVRGIEVTEKEVQKFLDEHGIDGEAEAFTIFRKDKKTLAPDEFTVFRDGKREVYKADPEIVESIRKLDGESSSLALKIASAPASWLRAGAVLTPDFMARNLSRDMVSAFNLAEGAYTPLHALSGLGSILKKDEHYQNWLKGGGANAAMVSIDRDYISKNIFKLSEETGLLSKTWNVVKSPFEMLRVTSELIENATRVGKSKKDMGRGADAFSAAFNSREVTLDFARKGRWGAVQTMNNLTAFFNAHVQGLDAARRALRERPAETSLKLAASITLPSVMLWMVNKDDPRWQDIPRWQKDLFWIVMTDDHIYRIPKPHELGLLFGSLPERVLEQYFTENPRAMKDFGESLGAAFTPGMIPTAAIPLVETWSNKSTFSGTPLVPAHLEKVLPEYQHTENTSEAAKKLGSFIAAIPGFRESQAASPMVLESVLRAWSGNTGRYFLELSNSVLRASDAPQKPTMKIEDYPVIRAFMIRHPSAQAQSISDFQNRHQEAKTVFATLDHLAKKGDLPSFKKELLLPENQEKFVKLDGIASALADQRRLIDTIHRAKNLTPDKKREFIDKIYGLMIIETKAGNQIMDTLERIQRGK